MNLEVYHQLGFRSSWNFQALAQEGVGKGVIFAPRHQGRTEIEGISDFEKQDYLFDPQFFLPSTPKGKLSTYDFFPQIVADGFSTSEYPEVDADTLSSAAQESAVRCVRFQRQNQFRYIVIPTRYMAGTPSDFVTKQQRLFVDPFLSARAEQCPDCPVALQVILTDAMLRESEYSADLLNWITGIPEVSAVYVILEVSRRQKQLKDPEILFQFLCFIDALTQNDLRVIVGYTNTEALILSLASPMAVTVGCYENTRMFNIRTFEDDDESRAQGPTPRLYVPSLLQWVDHRYIAAITRGIGASEEFFGINQHKALMFEKTFQWHFSKPELYRHGMLETYKQLRRIGEVAGRERYEAVSGLIVTARSWYSRLDDAGVVLDPESDGSHLAPWLTAANQFAHRRGWR